MIASIFLAASLSSISSAELVEAPSINAMALSPDGRTIAFRIDTPSVSTNQIKLDWYRVDVVGGGRPEWLADGGTAQFNWAGVPISEPIFWSPDSKSFWFRVKTKGAVSLWSWSRAEGARSKVSDAADILDFNLSSDGSRIDYTVGPSRAAIIEAERAAYDRGVVVDAKVDIMQPLAGGVIVEGERQMQRFSGPWFERARLLADMPTVTKRFTVASPQSKANANFSRNALADGDWSKSSQGWTARIERDKNGKQTVATNPEGKEYPCNGAVCYSSHLRAISWRTDRNELLLFLRDRYYADSIHVWNPESGVVRTVVRSEGVFESLNPAAPCPSKGDILVCVEATPIGPPQLVAINLDTGARSVLADPGRHLREKIGVKVERLGWSDDKGHDFTGLLLTSGTMPKKVPLVIHYYYCEGFLKGGVGDEIPMIPLAEQGFAVLCINKTPLREKLKIAEEYDAALSGILSIVERLAKEGRIDRNKVGIGGLSFGSEVALWAVRHSNRFAAATLASTQFEPGYFWANALPRRGVPAMLEKWWGLGSPDDDLADWKLLSAALDIDSVNTPLLMQLPESEARYVIELHSRLKRAGKPVELVAFADEPHIKIQPRHKVAVYDRNLAWFSFWLQDVKTSAHPEKQIWLQRWRTFKHQVAP